MWLLMWQSGLKKKKKKRGEGGGRGVKNTHTKNTHNSLDGWNAFIEVQQHIPADPQSSRLGNNAAATTTPTTTNSA